MAKTLRSPGQKRKLWIRSSMVVLALLGLTLAYFIKGPAQVAAIERTKHHVAAEATITSLDVKEEEYRGRKGRKKTREVYSVSYQYAVGGTQYQQEHSLSYGEYEDLSGKESLQVWFAEQKPEEAVPQIVVEHQAHESAVERVIDAAPYVIGLALLLNIVLTLLFGREPKGKLPEGFYTENSWLDIEDDRLVALDGHNLVSVSFDSKHTDNVQELYQSGAGLAAIVAQVACKQKVIDLNTVSKVTSDHFRDTIYLTFSVDGKESSESLEFLNATVKEHALKQIARALPASLRMSVEKLTRLQAARFSLIVALISAGALYYFLGNVLAVAGCVLVLLWSLKTAVQRLLDPTVTITFASNAPSGTPVVSE
ncbi:hypothetical protein A9179_00295 [Pseudomonas alcaligenes]|uniref:DUF3592 domain-containing protein n=1 Tax=Aquipseudomonas alcaligenes TaxID=43263 RepID=A0ABR7RWU4_AQUAC|nr:DUF3592 domain-containing protein [Pseudomonas alcaligenes]MBC9248703.1 hypothetical protein [Pseudomonas alcaligenes]